MGEVLDIIKKLALLGLALPILNACGGSDGALVLSNFETVTGTGSTAEVNVALDQESNRQVSDPAVGTVAYVTGFGTNRLEAFSGVAAGATVGAPVSNGTATYNATYEHTTVANISVLGSVLRGDRVTNSGTITLSADFDAGTVTGSDSRTLLFGGTSGLDVNGTISGTTLGGTVTARYATSFSTITSGSVTGPLAGSIGATGVIGAYHGSDSNTVVAGGLVGTP